MGEMTLTFGGVQPSSIQGLIHENVLGFQRLAIAVSYVQLSGWELLKPLFAGKFSEVRLLCTDQFGITDAAAVRALQKAGVVVHAYTGDRVFHPKVYIASFHGKPDRWVMGSANLSGSALQTGVEAAFSEDDINGNAIAWFDQLFANGSQPFDDLRLKALERANVARIKGNLATAQAKQIPDAAVPNDPIAAETIEAVFGALPDIVVPLNADKAGNNVRTFRRIKEILDNPAQLTGKAFSELKLIGLARDGGYTVIGQQAQGRSIPEIAKIWMKWLKAAPSDEIAAANPSGRLARAAIAFETFWSFPEDVRNFFLANATHPTLATRRSLQVIELLANAGRAMPNLTLADVSTLSQLLAATAQLSPRVRAIVGDYLDNKGTRGWSEPDRKIILEAWRDA